MMYLLSIPEFGRIARARVDEIPEPLGASHQVLSERHWRRLRRYDMAWRAKTNNSAGLFDWSPDEQTARARGFVGVLELGDLVIELLPKIEAERLDYEELHCHRRNLLVMLNLAGKLKLYPHEIAHQSTGSAPISEVLKALFARELFDVLSQNLQHAYIRVEESRPTLKGKLRFSRQIARYGGRADRFEVIHTMYDVDTPLNRLLKGVCVWLIHHTHSRSTIDLLHQSLHLLGEVQERRPSPEMFSTLYLSRQEESFARVIEIAKLLLSQRVSEARAGQDRTFSFLFEMHALYESFVAGLLRKHMIGDQLPQGRLILQGGQPKENLLFKRIDNTNTKPIPNIPPNPNSSQTLPSTTHEPALELKPDLIFETNTNRIILDTKWKRLENDKIRHGIPASDVYQMLAYSVIYSCPRAVLIYPKHTHKQETPPIYDAPFATPDGLFMLRVCLLDLSKDLTIPQHLQELVSSLAKFLR